jgi:hypothetical protein
VIQLVLPLHECAAEPLPDVVESVADPTAAESSTEPLHAITDPATALTKTSYLCVWV